MTVSELIAELNKVPGDLPVYRDDMEDNDCEVEHVKIESDYYYYLHGVKQFIPVVIRLGYSHPSTLKHNHINPGYVTTEVL